MSAPGARSELHPWRGFGPAAALLAGVAALPFLRGLWLGHSFYFRDLTISILPLRRFVVEGLLRGELRDWVPWVHEGSPLHLSPLGYPVELLQMLAPDEAGISLLLALHVPLAALSMLGLARRLGAGPVAGFAAGATYALGGFALSTLNFYFYTHSLAWAPLIVWALMAAGERPRSVAPAALVVGVGVSTFGAELVLQALIAGVVLAALPPGRGRLLRIAAAAGLGIAMAAVPFSLAGDLVPGSVREAGFTADVVLGHSVHPLSLMQVVIGSFHGDLSDPTRHWWGHNFFPRGFPYILSLYLGPLVLALAWLGFRSGDGPRLRLGLLVAAAVLLALGRWIGLTPLVESLPARPLRFPVKAFFTAHLGVALLAGLGLESLLRRPGGWRSLAGLATAAAAVLLGLALVPWWAPGAWDWFLTGFLPPGSAGDFAAHAAATLRADAAVGGAVVLCGGGLAWLAARGRLAPRGAAIGLAALVAADLIRTGAGLNPMVPPGFFRLSPAMQAQLDDLRRGRVFTCGILASAAYGRSRAVYLQRGAAHELLTFAVARETLSHHLSVLDRVPTARGIDLTMLVPEWRVLPPGRASCDDLDPLIPELRASAVHRVLSLDPLRHPELTPLRVVRPRRIEPLAIFVYALAEPLPLAEVAEQVRVVEAMRPGSAAAAPVAGRVRVADAGAEARGVSGRVELTRPSSDRIDLEVSASGPSAVVVREAWAAGWRASLDGRPVPALLADGRHLAVRIPGGASRVRLEYLPPSRGAALAVAAAAAAVAGLLAWIHRRRRDASAPEPEAPGAAPVT